MTVMSKIMTTYLEDSRTFCDLPNFEYGEFVVSGEYPDIAKNTDVTGEDKLKFYFQGLLIQAVRDKIDNGPIKVVSGKRVPQLNKLVGGAERSDHLYTGSCGAVDWRFTGNNRKLWDAMLFLLSECKYMFGQAILYIDSDNLATPKFMHTSLPVFYRDKKYWGVPAIMLITKNINKDMNKIEKEYKYYPLDQALKKITGIKEYLN